MPGVRQHEEEEEEEKTDSGRKVRRVRAQVLLRDARL